jgi:signal transduction histidine kinase
MENEAVDNQPEPVARMRFVQAALEAVRAGVVVVDPNGCIAFANGPARELLQEGALSTPYGQTVAVDELPVVRALTTGRPHAQLLLRRDSRDVLLGHGSPIHDDSGALIGAVGAFVDAASEDLAQVLDQAPVGVVVLRGDELVYEYVNAAFQAFAPDTPLVGRPFAVASWEMPEVTARLREVWATGKPWRSIDLPVTVVRSPDGPRERAFFSFVCAKVRRRTPPDALLGFVVETTEYLRDRERLDEALGAARRRAAELEAVIDTMLEGVIAYDEQRRITLINKSARRMLERVGVTPELLERPHEMLRALRLERADGRPLSPADLPVARALDGESSRVNLRFYNPLTHRHSYASIGGTPIVDSNRRVVGVVSVGSDVTEDTELDRLKDEFIRVIAHELKTPITIMKGYADVLLQTLGPTLSPAHQRMLAAVDRGAERINRIMCELLDAQQIDLGLLELVLERVDLLELINDVVDRVAARSPGHALHVRDARPMVLRADGERLREVMRILLDNAVRYSPGGGDVEVSLQRGDGNAILSVRDHGVGIPTDRREHLFERFYRAHTGTPHDYGGTGLGLYVARAIVERHGGTLRCDSVEGRGTTFTLRLPLTETR